MLLFEEIMNEKIFLFERNGADKIGYIIKMNISNMKEYRVKFYFIGRIPVKSLLNYLIVNCCINNISINIRR